MPNITIVNGKLLPQNIKQQSLKYPFVAAKLINAGWLATSRIPTDEEFEALCNEYNISPLNNYYTHEEEEEDSEIQIEEDDAERFEDILRGFYIEHDKIVSRARRYCGLEVPEEEEDTFDIEDTEEDFLEPISSSNTNSNPNLHDTSLNDQICIEKTQNGEVIERFGDENDSTSDSYQQPNLVSRVAEILRRNGLKVDPGNEHEDVLKLLSELCDRNPTTNESQMIDQIRAKND
ncbi:hypothetical protein TRFO_10752 [Tritrichomonas foetus]|uniref:Uncharacterized protein n=1 Tax=Tritrichomonas foetus TaxID=1144522 RepID=A0A1J4JBK4_9EUKA|nr:hypothetical protein TRFO_10752 [Tritrichomonas foetus]|eukprot:OHS95035.1 hypothetical protein TRFO_10752 [Tritrichomonas foetus]